MGITPFAKLTSLTKPEPMGKPHLRPWMSSPFARDDKWLCYGRFWRGVGSTPEEAYERWCEAIKEMRRK